MIVNKGNFYKSNNNFKKNYGRVNSLNKLKKERINSAFNSSNKIKFLRNRKIKIKKLKIIKNSVKLNNKYYVLDIIKIKHIARKETNKTNDNQKVSNSNSFNMNSTVKENKIVQTDKEYHIKINNNLYPKKDYKILSKPCKSILEYRIKRNKQRQRNKEEIKEENINNSSMIKLSGDNVVFPNIYSKERNIQDYLNISNRKKSQRNLNIKNYNKVLNNLRIKFKGNIHITRKSKCALSIISYQKNAGIKNFNEFIRNSANLNDDKSYENTNISRYEHICSFSNEMIKESLYENKVENIYKNINIKCK